MNHDCFCGFYRLLTWGWHTIMVKLIIECWCFQLPLREDSTPLATDWDADTADSVHSAQLEVLILKMHVLYCIVLYSYTEHLQKTTSWYSVTLLQKCLYVYVPVTSVWAQVGYWSLFHLKTILQSNIYKTNMCEKLLFRNCYPCLKS